MNLILCFVGLRHVLTTWTLSQTDVHHMYITTWAVQNKNADLYTSRVVLYASASSRDCASPQLVSTSDALRLGFSPTSRVINNCTWVFWPPGANQATSSVWIYLCVLRTQIKLVSLPLFPPLWHVRPDADWPSSWAVITSFKKSVLPTHTSSRVILGRFGLLSDHFLQPLCLFFWRAESGSWFVISIAFTFHWHSQMSDSPLCLLPGTVLGIRTCKRSVKVRRWEKLFLGWSMFVFRSSKYLMLGAPTYNWQPG